MIKKLLVLNGTEGYKFEVGKQYINSDDVQMVTGIYEVEDEFYVSLGDDSTIIVKSNNVLVFKSR